MILRTQKAVDKGTPNVGGRTKYKYVYFLANEKSAFFISGVISLYSPGFLANFFQSNPAAPLYWFLCNFFQIFLQVTLQNFALEKLVQKNRKIGTKNRK